MRTKEILGIMLLFLCISCFMSCDKDDDNVGEIVVISISPELVWVSSTSSIPAHLAMECTIEENNKKLHIAEDQIEGFEYNKGYEYKLKVRITPLENPATDGSTDRYELIEIISQYETPFKIQLKYAVDAEQKSIIEDDLRDNSSFLVGSGYVFNKELSTWTLVDADNIPISNGKLHRESGYPVELPASYKLLPTDEQIATYAKFIFSFQSGSEQIEYTYDAIITYIAGGGRDPYCRLWFYEDLTDYYKTKYPDAGVKGVVRVQRLSYNNR